MTTDTQGSYLQDGGQTLLQITRQQSHSLESYFQDCGRTLLQDTREQAHRSMNSKTTVEHYYKSQNRHTARSLICKTAVKHYYNHTTTGTQDPSFQTDIQESYLQDGGQTLLQIARQQSHSLESYFQDCCRTLLQDTRQQAHRSINSKTTVEHYYKSQNRHTARSLICKTAVKQYYNHTTTGTQEY